jgi:outer membrane protein assembly factor BamB
MSERLRWSCCLALAAVALAAVALASPAEARPAAVSYQIDVAHSGRVVGGGPAPPLRRIWQRDLGDQLSYPLIVGSRVFVTARRVGSAVSADGAVLYALDRATGRILWARAVSGSSSLEPAYGNGRVFLATVRGPIRAIDARTGLTDWIDDASPAGFYAAPVAHGGRVYAAGGFVGTFTWAYRASDGAVLWRGAAPNLVDAPVAVDGGVVYGAGQCADVVAVRERDGGTAWSHYTEENCVGQVTEPAGVVADRLLVPSYGFGPFPTAVFARHDGALLTRTPADLLPTAVGGLMVSVERGALVARDPGSGTLRWRLRRRRPFDIAPLAGRNRIYAATRSGQVLVVDARSGRPRWRGRAPGGPVEARAWVTNLRSGLAADSRVLLVPAGGRLVVFARGRPRGRSRPPRRAAPVPARTPGAATTFQLDPSHRGWSPRSLRPPLRLAWTRPLGPVVSYPVIADGRVFAASAGPEGEGVPGRLEAIDARSGRASWSQRLPSGADFVALTYGAGIVVVATSVGYESEVTAYRARSGEPLWTRTDLHDLESAPVTAGHSVYIAAYAAVHALDLATGQTRWVTRGTISLLPGGPGLADGRLFVADACGGADALRQRDGAQLWESRSTCSGHIGGPTPIVVGDRLRLAGPGTGYLLDARRGGLIDAPTASPPPAVGPRVAVVTAGDVLHGEEPRTGRLFWTRRAGESLGPPLLLGRYAWVSDQAGRLFAFDSKTGRRLWSRRLGRGTPPWWNEPLGGMAAANGLLVLPTEGRLLAFRDRR